MHQLAVQLKAAKEEAARLRAELRAVKDELERAQKEGGAGALPWRGAAPLGLDAARVHSAKESVAAAASSAGLGLRAHTAEHALARTQRCVS